MFFQLLITFFTFTIFGSLHHIYDSYQPCYLWLWDSFWQLWFCVVCVRKHGIDRHTKQYLLEFRCQLISFLVRRIECFSFRDLARVMQFWFTSNHGYLWKMKKRIIFLVILNLSKMKNILVLNYGVMFICDIFWQYCKCVFLCGKWKHPTICKGNLWLLAVKS